MILLIDNYDSFTYNLYQSIEELGFPTRVVRNDELSVSQISKLKPEAIVLSPGPGHPGEAGVTLDIIRSLKGKFPILGVCLGHQAIGQAFGGEVVRAPRQMHGKTSRVKHRSKGVFSGLPNPMIAMRYHSLVVSREKFPKELEITAESEDRVIMGLRHRKYPIEGVQFHPESFATVDGKDLLKNFLDRAVHKKRKRRA
jgi:anthranilate synthase/aminodeoxychorismate synthase-like glutamine amidotransferase